MHNPPTFSIPGSITSGANVTVTKTALGYEIASSGGGGGGYDEGSSFPGTPGTDDKFYRTDRNLLYVYDGTRWLTVQQYVITLERNSAFPGTPISATTSAVYVGGVLIAPDHDLWMEHLCIAAFVSTTNDGTKFWSFQLQSDDATPGSPTTIVTPDTSAASPGVYLSFRTAIGALLGTGARQLVLNVTKTSTPGNVQLWGVAVVGRLVG